MKPYIAQEPTPHEEALMRDLRQKCVIESYGPYEVRVDYTRCAVKAEPAYGELSAHNGLGESYQSAKEGQITPEVIAAARARLNLSLVELDILERGIKAMEE